MSGAVELVGLEQRFQLLVDAVADYAIYLLDPEGRISSWNSGAARIKGYTAAEVIGTSFARFYTPEDQAAGRPALALRVAREQGRFEDEGWRIRKDGTRFWAATVINRIRTDAGELIGFAKTTRDITERRETQQALEAAREQLFQLQKLDALGQLTGGVAHDFNNLLMVILGNLELARPHAADRPALVRALGSIQTAAQRAVELTQRLLTFSRRQPLKMETLQLTERLPQTLDLVRRSLRGDIALETAIDPDLWPIKVDPTQLDLAILNVALNARDAMPEGGVLRITVGNVERAEAEQRRLGRHIAIRIADTGTGIPQELLSKVLEPFFTTKEVGKGNGLGLSQAHGFATQSGGVMTIESRVGRGTSVTFRLPAELGKPAADASETVAEPPSPGASILLVEDNKEVADLAAELLSDAGYKVTRAERAEAALDILARGEPVDLVFSDVVMPGAMSGVEMARVIRQRHKRLPVLLATGYSDVTAQDFPLLGKPYDVRRLLSEISSLLAASHSHTGRIAESTRRPG
jgi:PAS domain S-box-containing protein